ncbi:glycosyltransferase [Sphingobium nicotianae]|uniref:Glycosyltransferase n=1 Tax=Sphingobium nicotianae TaxID=2782607 RepID=A0A9X1DCE7_9SPHN|nr:glycosyltransferase [Sphingobium nicotianae]MBT2187388.1 glycosyltransferase [Sphingobium nicotianae]
MRKIVLATIGTLGDLHPFLAVAKALQARGFRPILGCPADHVKKALATDIEAVAILPSFDEICARMGAERSDAAHRIISNQRYMFEEVILPDLSSSAARLTELTEGAAAIVASPFALGAPIAAEKCGVPLVSAVLQPMALLSALDPPNTRDFAMMKRCPVGTVGAGWNRLVYASLHGAMRISYGRKISSARASHGLGRSGKAPLKASPLTGLTLGLYSRYFAPLPLDAAPNTQLVGFPWFDGDRSSDEHLDQRLAEFLAAGPPPLVFSLGTLAIHAAGRFYDEAEKVARAIGMRAILLTGKAEPATSDCVIFRCAYAPHAQLFPHCAAIVHHGGIGTVGQALRAGKPQMVVPHMGDQFDHAHRIAGLGVGATIKAARFRERIAAPALLALLRDRGISEKAAALAASIGAEDGPSTAAAAIEAMLATEQCHVIRPELQVAGTTGSSRWLS